MFGSVSHQLLQPLGTFALNAAKKPFNGVASLAQKTTRPVGVVVVIGAKPIGTFATNNQFGRTKRAKSALCSKSVINHLLCPTRSTKTSADAADFLSSSGVVSNKTSLASPFLFDAFVRPAVGIPNRSAHTLTLQQRQCQ